MSYGSFQGLWRYVKKVFNIEEKLDVFSDPRRDSKKVPLKPVLLTWLCGMIRKVKSTEQIGELFLDQRWRKIMDLTSKDGGSPDTVARVLDVLDIDEWNKFLLDMFFVARRAGIFKDGSLYGNRIAILDLNELFKSEKIHCPDCQVRTKKVKDKNGQVGEVKEYYHQAVAMVWSSGDITWPLGWELLTPGEGELSAAFRLMERLLPKLGKSIDLVMGDGLYCCRNFFKIAEKYKIGALAVSSGMTEMDEEIDLLMETEKPKKALGSDVEYFEMESEAWFKELKRTLRIVHYRRLYEAEPWKNERETLRLVMSASVGVIPTRQGWKIGRSRWKIENDTFNIMTRDYSLTHNFRHSSAAIVALLILRSLAYCFIHAYHSFATARSKNLPMEFRRWYQLIADEDWVRFLDRLFPSKWIYDSS